MAVPGYGNRLAYFYGLLERRPVIDKGVELSGFTADVDIQPGEFRSQLAVNLPAQPLFAEELGFDADDNGFEVSLDKAGQKLSAVYLP